MHTKAYDMENFIVSARKYRPNKFDTVVGQNHITATLKNAIKNKQLAQAFLFTGPRGVGKTTCARILAKTINCENLTENTEACNICESCKAFDTSASFNIHELDAASNNSVEDIRALVEQVRIPPQAVRYKVYIIDEVHMLSSQAFNAFLKTLEEPPLYAKFILATTEKHKIIPTILSRCQIFDFNRITVDDIAKHLAFVAGEENIDAETDALHVIAQKADGALRDALSIFDQMASFSGNKITYQDVIDNLNVLDVNVYFELSDLIMKNNISQILLRLNEIFESGHDAHHFINGFGDHFRNLLVCRDPETIVLLEVSPNIKEKYKIQAQNCKTDLLLKGIEICSKTDINYKVAGNKRLLIELALLQMCSLCNSTTDKTLYATQTYVQPKTESPKIITAQKTEPISKPQTIASTELPKKEEKKDISKGSVSFSSLYNKPEQNSDVVNEQKEKLEPVKVMDTDFSNELLSESWSTYSNLEKHSPNFKAILITTKPEKKDFKNIILHVGNPLHETEIKNNQQDILIFLQENLKNNIIEIQLSITQDNTDKNVKPFTVKDKFKSMSEKNPDIVKLKNKLELDFDY